jgi:hypothetical protein
VTYAEYDRVDATEIDRDGNLRLYRRRGPFGLLRRQDIFHPRGEWLTYMVHPSGKCTVTIR